MFRVLAIQMAHSSQDRKEVSQEATHCLLSQCHVVVMTSPVPTICTGDWHSPLWCNSSSILAFLNMDLYSPIDTLWRAINYTVPRQAKEIDHCISWRGFLNLYTTFETTCLLTWTGRRLIVTLKVYQTVHSGQLPLNHASLIHWYTYAMWTDL